MVQFDRSLERLEYLEKQSTCSDSVKYQIQTLKTELKFLNVFFKCREVKRIEDKDLISRFRKISVIIQDVGKGIRAIYTEAKNGKVLLDLDRSLLSLQEKVDLIKPEVGKLFCSISKLPKEYVSYDDIVKLNDYVLENLKDLLQSKDNLSVGEQKLIDTLERRLRFLWNSLQFADKLKSYRYYLTDEVAHAALAAALFLFTCWINKGDENKGPDREPDLSRALKYRFDWEKTSIYLSILKDSESLASDAADALLVDFINFLLKNLAELLNRDSGLEIPIKDRFESLHEELKLVTTLLEEAGMQQAGHEKSYREHIGPQVDKAAYLIAEFFIGNMSEGNDTDLLRSLRKIKVINLTCMVERINHEAILEPALKDQLENVCEDMRLLKVFALNTEKIWGYMDDSQVGDILSHIGAVNVEAGSAIHSFYIGKTKPGVVEEMSVHLPGLLEKIELIKAEMRKVYPNAPSSYSHDTTGQRDITLSLKELNDLLNSKADTIFRFLKPEKKESGKLHIGNVQSEVKILISSLEDSEVQCTESEELKALQKSVMNIVNEAKYSTDPYFFKDHPDWYCMLKLCDVMEELKLFKKEIERFNKKISIEMQSSQGNALVMGEVIVGFEDAANNIIEQLIGGSEQLQVISMIGMAGLGKTTLARKLYSNPSVVGYFHVRAWCCISQVFQKRQLLLDILGQVVELTEEIYQRTDEDLKEMLYKNVKGLRYLIVMDDIWDIAAWTAIRRCFCDDTNGSRIVFTTRITEIAWNVQARSIPHQLRPFNDDESLELLQKKLFPGRRCPKEQEGNMKQIAEKCKGLPLAVVLIAGVLASKKKEEWEQVAESLSQYTDGGLQDLGMEVLELSYMNLPDHLRPCFLYLGAFPEDGEIPTKKLTWLWTAEGFIQKIEQRSLEDIAKGYLMDLIGRSLLIVAEIGSRGGVKACRVHDLLRSFCLAKAKEEKFLFLLDENDEPFATLDPMFHQQLDGYVESYNSNPITYRQYRVSIYSMLQDLKKWPSSMHVCSLLHFSSIFPSSKTSYDDVSFIFSGFKFLNVLDLGRLLLRDLNCEILLLVHLRLLAVHIQSNSIPSQIAKLRNLETFLVKGIKGEVAIPSAIWGMKSLRHLHVDNRASLIWEMSDIKKSSLDNLETLSTPFLSYGTKSNDVISSLPNLLKLKCIVTGWSDFESCNHFIELDSLHQLESLKMFYYATKVCPGKYSLPSSLKKLTLSKFQLPWSDITAIGTALPNLEVLKLLWRAFDGKQWETGVDVFPKLKYLKLEALHIERWDVSSEEHFPVLEKLVLHRCKHLGKIPSTLGDINTLQLIEVKWCSRSGAKSARDIEQEQKEMGNEALKIIIHPSDQGRTSSS